MSSDCDYEGITDEEFECARDEANTRDRFVDCVQIALDACYEFLFGRRPYEEHMNKEQSSVLGTWCAHLPDSAFTLAQRCQLSGGKLNSITFTHILELHNQDQDEPETGDDMISLLDRLLWLTLRMEGGTNIDQRRLRKTARLLYTNPAQLLAYVQNELQKRQNEEAT